MKDKEAREKVEFLEQRVSQLEGDYARVFRGVINYCPHCKRDTLMNPVQDWHANVSGYVTQVIDTTKAEYQCLVCGKKWVEKETFEEVK